MTDKKIRDDGAAPQPEEAGTDESGTAEEVEAERSLEELQTEVETLRDHLLRAKAEVQNILKRSEREKSEIAQYAIAGFARDLLSVADNLRRALEAVPPDAADNPALKALVEGVEMTERELLSVFERHGVRRIAPKPGERFDHTHQQAVAEVESEDHAPGAVAEVYQVGYALGERLLRPAMVAVAKARRPQDGAAATSPGHVDTEA